VGVEIGESLREGEERDGRHKTEKLKAKSVCRVVERERGNVQLGRRLFPIPESHTAEPGP
jgi:hypothetical protein